MRDVRGTRPWLAHGRGVMWALPSFAFYLMTGDEAS